MPYSLLPTLLIQLFLIGYTPGPANIYSLAMSLKYSRKRVLIMWTGLLAGFSTALVIMALLTHLIGITFGDYVPYLKYFGAAYLVYLAYKIATSHRNQTDSGKDCSFFSGFVVQITNAKMLLFDLTVFSTFVLPYSSKFISLLEVGAWLLIAGPGANMVWLLCGSYLKKFFSRYGRQVDIVSAIALLLCAIYVVL